MRQYNPSPRTDQEVLYWTSGHGMKLKETGDEQVAHCVDCHGGKHSIVAVDNVDSPVYPTNVAHTCQQCHGNEQLMEGRIYQGRPIGHDQYAQWNGSVHAKALQQGDTSAATCNDCHGNHGAVPPQVDSVANACGTCHSKIAELFSGTQMQHRFEEVGLPGCVTCHGNHEILEPSDEMLGMTQEAVCAQCHAGGEYGATLAGAQTARRIGHDFEQLKQQIAEAEEKIAKAERLGMPIGGPRYNLRSARQALIEARTQVHAFAAEPVQGTLRQGLDVASEVIRRTEDVLWQYDFRRIWLAVSLLPILIVIVLLLLYIRTRGTAGRTQPPDGGGKRPDLDSRQAT
jgi:predicted CXXCH cytochrome family protein